jgi:hypothetical protein
MADDRLKNLRGTSRRRFLKFASAVGAGLALERSEVLNLISDSAGSAMADEASCAVTNRSVHLVAGNGGFAWFQLLWPHNGIAASNNNNFAFHAFGQTEMAPDTDKPQTWGPETPWKTLGPTHRMTALMAGNNETHTAQPTSAAALGGGVSMLAAAASLQNELPSLLPVIGITPFSFGTAPGAPAVTTVGSGGAMVDLFNSSASQAILSVPRNASLYEAYYKAFLGLNRAAGLPTWSNQLRISKASANFLGQNLASQLMPADADFTRYGIGQGAPNNIRNLAEALIVSVKAFKLGLTNSVIMPALRDDPHGAFNDMTNLQNRVTMLGTMFDGFYNDLLQIPDPACAGKSLGDTTVMTIHGDTPKNPRNRSGWPDGTPGGSNWVYVMGAGLLKTGWFGGIDANDEYGFDPSTGNDILGQDSSVTAAPAGAAVAFAIAQGDMQRVNQFYNGPAISGLVNAVLL